MKSAPEISVVVPVYKSVESLQPLFEGINKIFLTRKISYEVLFVLDGPFPDSWEALQKLKAAYPEAITLLQLSRNFGQNSATICGIEQAKSSLIITLDDDLQTPPKEIDKLLTEYDKSGADVIYGVNNQPNNSKFKNLGSKWIKKIFARIEGGGQIGSSFRLISPEIVENLKGHSQDHLFINQIISWYTTDIHYIQVEHHPRVEGKSGYKFLHLFGLAARLLLYYSTFPLKLMIYVGLLVSVVCIFLIAYFIYQKVMYGSELGFTSIIVAIFFATGMLMTSFSIVGIYINRIYNARIKKPSYVIKKKA